MCFFRFFAIGNKTGIKKVLQRNVRIDNLGSKNN